MRLYPSGIEGLVCFFFFFFCKGLVEPLEVIHLKDMLFDGEGVTQNERWSEAVKEMTQRVLA